MRLIATAPGESGFQPSPARLQFLCTSCPSIGYTNKDAFPGGIIPRSGWRGKQSVIQRPEY